MTEVFQWRMVNGVIDPKHIREVMKAQQDALRETARNRKPAKKTVYTPAQIRTLNDLERQARLVALPEDA